MKSCQNTNVLSEKTVTKMELPSCSDHKLE